MKIKEHKIEKTEEEKVENKSFVTSVKEFFAMSPEVGKICTMQFFTWIGTMCMMIFFTQYAVHTIFKVPDLTEMTAGMKLLYDADTLAGTNFSSICFAIFNFICFVVAIPIGILSEKFGNKKVHIVSLVTMICAYIGMYFTKSVIEVAVFMGIAGIGWASICALPFAMLSKYIKKGTEGSVMGIFNIFIAGPQVFVCTLVAWMISKTGFALQDGLINYRWEDVFLIGASCLMVATLITNSIEEK